MARGISLAPKGLVVERLETAADKIIVVARPISETAAYPNCTQVSKSVHSRYQRSLSDLPSDGRAVQINIRVRRFRCGQADCLRRVFAERLEHAVTSTFSRRTERLEGIVHHLGLALAGRPGQSFARRLVIPVSKTPCCGWSGAGPPNRPARPRWSASATGLEARPSLRDDHLRPGTTAHRRPPARSGKRRQLPRGLPSTPPSPSSPATVGRDLYRQPPKADLRRCRSPTAGI